MDGAAELPRLLLITDASLPFEVLVERLGQALSAGPKVAVQLRAPDAPGRVVLEQARALAELCARTGNALFINGRVDVALAVGAHVHLPAHGFTPEQVRPLMRKRWISSAVHDAAEAERARGADLVLTSPVFAPASKPGDLRTPLGADGLAALARRCDVPTFALGGMTPERTSEVRPFGVAAIGGVLHAADPRGAAIRFLEALDSCDPPVP